MPEIPLTIEEIRDGLHSGTKLGPLQFTYSIPDADSFWETDYTSDPSPPPPDPPNNRQPFDTYSVLSAAQGANFELALAAWDALILPNFTEVADTAVSHGEVRIAFTADQMDSNTAGYAFSGSNQTPTSIVGDIWLNSSDTGQSYDEGSNDYSTLLHEIGHVLGLKHPFVPTTIPAPYETTRYSVMSYTEAGRVVTFTGAFGGPIGSSSVAVAQITPMVLDIAAVQDLYGADPNTNVGDTVYVFDEDDAFLQSIYDAGGTDTLDLSSITRPNIIDLTPGSYSTVASFTVAAQTTYWQSQYDPFFAAFIADQLDNPGVYTWTDNVGIAFSTTIENVIGGSVDDRLFGNDAANALNGGAGNDVLLGGDGNDSLTGGTGNDTFYVENAGDSIAETDGEGTDRVAAEVNYTLAAGASVEQLDARDLTGTGALDLTGNEFAQTIVGNAGVNALSGGGGADVINGFSGNDALNGDDGNDVLIGAGGDDAMDGGLGDDTFYVEDAGDTVAEAVGEGSDRLATLLSYVLAAGAEVERLDAVNLSDTTALDLTGNEFNNTLLGNAGVNTLNGGDGHDVLFAFMGNDALNGGGGNDILIGDAGTDTMDGGLGDDVFYVEDAADVLVEVVGEGYDRAATTVSYTLTAGASIDLFVAATLTATAALDLTGNALGQSLAGNAGDNMLDGKGGTDVLYGHSGADTFAFTTALGPDNVDQIEDMASGTDTIALDDAVFAALGGLGALDAEAFATGALGVATEADDRIVYDPVTGALYYDADGSGVGSSAVQFAQLVGAPALAASDFVVI